DSAAVERSGDRALVRQGRREVSFWRIASLDRLHEFFKALHPVDFFGVANLGRIEAATKHVDRFIVGLERYGKRVTVLATEREGKASRIRKTGRRTMNDFRDHRQRLQCSRTDILEQQKRREITQPAI